MATCYDKGKNLTMSLERNIVKVKNKDTDKEKEKHDLEIRKRAS